MAHEPRNAQNIAPYTPYNKRLMPGSWRSWWRFGSGALGDIGCQMMGVPFYSSSQGSPIKMTWISSFRNCDSDGKSP